MIIHLLEFLEIFFYVVVSMVLKFLRTKTLDTLQNLSK